MTLLEFNPDWFDSNVLRNFLQCTVESVEYQHPWEADSFVTMVVKFRNRYGVLLKANMWLPEYNLYVTMEQLA